MSQSGDRCRNRRGPRDIVVTQNNLQRMSFCFLATMDRRETPRSKNRLGFAANKPHSHINITHAAAQKSLLRINENRKPNLTPAQLS